MQERILNIINKDNLCKFFMGKYYPIVTCVLVATGSIFGIEYFLNFINTALIITALIVSNSVKPLLIGLITYVYQVSISHAPGCPTYSDYYYTSWRLPVTIIIIGSLVAALSYFVIKNKIYKRISLRGTPLLVPLLVFSLALFLNGAFSTGWSFKNMLFSFAHISVYLLLFLLIYHGFSDDERAEDLASYFAYISMLIAFLISAEVTAVFISSDNIFIDGSINKEGVILGWGIWNLIGVSSAVLIPMNFYGMQKNKYPWLYFVSATLIYIISVLSMSRNALIFASLAYAVCIIIFCFTGKYKKHMRIVTIAGVLFVLAAGVLMWDKISSLLADYIERGFDNNGRFDLWETAIDRFAAAPIFGSGFFGFESDRVLGILPWMAHNTLFQLLSSLGIFGTAAYCYYRIMSVMPLVKKPNITKTMLGLSILILLFESLLDNFIFNIYPMFYAQTALAIALKKSKEENLENQ